MIRSILILKRHDSSVVPKSDLKTYKGEYIFRYRCEFNYNESCSLGQNGELLYSSYNNNRRGSPLK